jgi:hypothetical protein
MNADNTVSALSAADFRTAIGASTVGSNFYTLTNPNAVTFPRMNLDNSVSALSASDFRTAIGVNAVADSWNINGNSSITSSDFIGPTNNASLIFKVGAGVTTFAGQIQPASTAIFNTSFGLGSNPTSDLTGIQNSAFGAGALASNTTGDDNTAVGQGALTLNQGGSNNTAVGQGSLASNTLGTSNTALGQASLNQLAGSLAATSYNTAIGRAALETTTGGLDNTAIGYIAGRNFGATFTDLATDQATAVTRSVMIGSRTRPLLSSSDNEIVIGYDAVGNGSNTMQLGNTSLTRVNTSGAIHTTNSVNARRFVSKAGASANLYNHVSAITGTTDVVLSGNDAAGVITFTAGPSATPSGDFLTVTFVTPYGTIGTDRPVVVIHPVRISGGTGPGVATEIYCAPSKTTLSTFTISANNLLNGANYEIAYHVIGR